MLAFSNPFRDVRTEPDDEARAVSWSTAGKGGIDGVCQARPLVND
ncbi:MAG: hypothetical protein ACKV19_01205 [Verrucomicrobiales bacterium]